MKDIMLEPQFDPNNLDPGIRDVVLALREAGFETCDSGDGVSKPAAQFASGEALPFPHIACIVPPIPTKAADMTSREEAMIRQLYAIRAVGEAHRLWTTLAALAPHAWQVELSYDPQDEIAMLMVTASEAH